MRASQSHDIESVLWESTAGAWIFLTVPLDVSEEIRDVPRPPAPGFGSLRVQVTLGASTWATSLFPDAKSGCYYLPVKKQIRVAEKIGPGDPVSVHLELLE